MNLSVKKIISVWAFLVFITGTPVWSQSGPWVTDFLESEAIILVQTESLLDGPAEESLKKQKVRGPGEKKNGKLLSKEKREHARKRVEMVRMLQLMEVLDLDEEEAIRIFSRLRPIDEKRWNLLKNRQGILRNLRKAGGPGGTDQKEVQSLMKAMKDSRSAFNNLDEEELAALDGILSPQQQAKYMIFKERFNREVKERIKKARQKNRNDTSPGERAPMRRPVSPR